MCCRIEWSQGEQRCAAVPFRQSKGSSPLDLLSLTARTELERQMRYLLCLEQPWLWQAKTHLLLWNQNAHQTQGRGTFAHLDWSDGIIPWYMEAVDIQKFVTSILANTDTPTTAHRPENREKIGLGLEPAQMESDSLLSHTLLSRLHLWKIHAKIPPAILLAFALQSLYNKARGNQSQYIYICMQITACCTPESRALIFKHL